jgi:hypothetical protein
MRAMARAVLSVVAVGCWGSAARAAVGRSEFRAIAGAVLSVVAVAAGSWSAPDRAAGAPARTGSVVQTTATRAYLDRGSAHGLAPGTHLALLRRGAPAGSCLVEYVSEHHATCRGDGARPGDTFLLPVSAAPAETAPPRARPEPLSPEEEAGRRAALAAAPQPLHEYRGPVDTGLGRRWKAEWELGHASWITTSSSAFSRESVSVGIRGAEVAPGLRLYLDATAWSWTARPDEARYRPEADTQLLVHRAEVSAREPGSPFALAAGRLWPWHAPAVTLFDGVQAGWRSPEGGAEAGLFGGGVPEALTVAPSFATWTAGGYWAVTRAADGALVPWLRHEGQVSVVEIDGAGRRFDAAGRVRGTVVPGVDGGLELRGILGGDADAALTGFLFDVGVRPADRVRLAADFRWLDREGLALEAAGTPLVLATSRRANAHAAWDAAPWLSVAAIAGLSQDVDDHRLRRWFGPELAFPRVFGERGGLDVGYQEEVGWLAGRMAWVGANALPWDRLRLWGRLSYFETSDGNGPDPEPLREGGLWLSARARLLPWLFLDGSLLFRAAAEASENADLPLGIYGDLRLRGEL